MLREECLGSSMIKSTCDGEPVDLASCKLALGKEKIFMNLF